MTIKELINILSHCDGDAEAIAFDRSNYTLLIIVGIDEIPIVINEVKTIALMCEKD
jgi:hypothetical protein